MSSRSPSSAPGAFRTPTGLASGRFDRLRELDDDHALGLWLDLKAHRPLPDRDAIVARLSMEIAAIDELLSEQLDAVLHHPRFQALEAAWRGVCRLTDQLERDREDVKIRMLDVTWRELARDIDRAIEFDQSNLFRKVYSAEFGTPGGEPFGVLIGDYAIRHRRSREHQEDDIGTLRGIAEVAAAAFAPFVASAHPSLLELDSFRDLERFIDIEATFRSSEYTAWNSLRKREDTRFVGLSLPRILMRAPYRDDPTRADGFVYHEDTSQPNGAGLLWGSAAWAFGEVLIRTFAENGWLASIGGVERDTEGRGLVTTLPEESFRTDRPGVVPKGGVEVRLTSAQERALGEAGFLALTHCHGTPYAAFYGTQSVHAHGQPTVSRQAPTVAEVNAKLSSMLQYMFCVSRFAHYVKVIARDKVGSFTRAEEVERLLRDWLTDYATTHEAASTEMQARYPLREARVEVKELPGRPGVFQTIVQLRPHYQLDQMTSSVRLVTELFAGRES